LPGINGPNDPIEGCVFELGKPDDMHDVESTAYPKSNFINPETGGDIFIPVKF